jgi:RNA polymerase sigma-70 factor (ECF subfamily)
LRALGDERLRELVEGFVGAWERADIGAVVDLLTDDVALTMPPIPTWFQGRATVGAFFARAPLAEGRRWRVVPTRANGQLAFGFYLWDDDEQEFTPHSIDVVTLDGDRVAALTVFMDTPPPFREFGLPLILYI